MLCYKSERGRQEKITFTSPEVSLKDIHTPSSLEKTFTSLDVNSVSHKLTVGKP